MALPRRVSPELRYMKVANALRKAIRDGTYQPGERLPRQHDLASNFNVAFSTLKQALDLLETEGYVVRRIGQGTYADLPSEHEPIALVVDDDDDVRDFFKRVLANNGWESIAVASGEEALSQLKGHPFDLIFLDLVMAGMNGAETFREIRRMVPAALVVVVTAYPDSTLMYEALKAGPLAVMRKPFTLDDLHRVLGYVAEGSDAARSKRR